MWVAERLETAVSPTHQVRRRWSRAEGLTQGLDARDFVDRRPDYGAVDRLDFTVIGPAVNEVARIETLCEPLGRKVLISAELASVLGDSRRLERSATTRYAACGTQERSTRSILALK